ncbi:ATP-binding protein [Bradyrhizobium erythrophlei]|uniref:Histidine kinase-, DNA gyrase B-, and HSP90-like ATPase n=1 Tax=Bradyrhizobium erythrophlei TaxID=1437360 RepID=A0A1M5PRE3_9BRAD|nr:ATP-binding protein [Bradyrhizobium erythrophlei]SHH04280.1 Histidine kinase-, DNA gyrase B-, and HSP90-like ATPase [Bradyrhizobium erythrophlei]
MKLGMQEHVDVAAGVQDEVAISFEANAVAFYAQISGLAKDKIGYPIRELSTNAWDASKGNFEVYLPTGLNPVFRVRDYGPGMSGEDMKNVYARLYASTKRSTNDQVGGWGLGSKSPFAYLIGADGAGSYNVTSYHGGMMRTYVLSLSAGGAPMMRLLAEMPSDEPTGIDVSFPVRREDIRAFNTRASGILWSFNPRPKITPEMEWTVPTIKSSGEGWTSYKSNDVPFYGPHVRMGCVMYPFDLRQIESTGFLVDSDTVLFDAPIGSLKVTLSREELAYDENTKTTLKNLVATYEQSFISQVRAKVDAAETLFQAVQVFEDETEQLGHSRAHALYNVITWHGHRLTATFNKVDFKTCMLGEGWKTFDKFEDMSVRQRWAVDATVAIEHNPSYSLGRFDMAGLIGKKVLWIRCKRINRDAVLAALGNPEVVDLDTFKVPVEKRVSKTIRKRRTMVVSRRGVTRLTQDVDMADGGYFVESAASDGWRRRGSDFVRIEANRGAISGYDFDGVVETCVEMGILEHGQVILIKAADQELGDNWTFLGEDVIAALKAKVDVTQFTGLHQKNMNHLDRNLKNFSEAPHYPKAPEDIKQFRSELNVLVGQLSSTVQNTTESDKAYAVLQKLGVSVEKPQIACPINTIQNKYNALCMTYPLLGLILKTGGYYGLDRESKAQLKHYFELLVEASDEAPQVAGMAEAEEEEEDELALDDLDEAA